MRDWWNLAARPPHIIQYFDNDRFVGPELAVILNENDDDDDDDAISHHTNL
jgi:hypothetical protein